MRSRRQNSKVSACGFESETFATGKVKGDHAARQDRLQCFANYICTYIDGIQNHCPAFAQHIKVKRSKVMKKRQAKT